MVYRSTAITIMKKNFIDIAKCLGIALPACLMASTAEASMAKVSSLTDVITQEKVTSSQVEPNSVKDRIIQAFNEETTESPYQIAHTNVHANYRVSHTDVHNNYWDGNYHSDSHSNTPSKHVDDHSNSKI